MDPFAPIKFLILIWRFARGVPTYLEDEKVTMDEVPEHLKTDLRKLSKRYVRYAIVGALLVVVIVPAIAVWYVSVRDGLTRKDSIGRYVMMYCMSPVKFFLGLFGGVSLGIMQSPGWFLECPVGEKWIKLSGADSAGGAKFVAFLVVAATVAFCAVTFWLVGVMAPFD